MKRCHALEQEMQEEDRAYGERPVFQAGPGECEMWLGHTVEVGIRGHG